MRQWRIALDADVEAAGAALAEDRLWNACALADLEPPWRQYGRVALAEQTEGTGRAALSLFRHPAFGSIIPHGDPEGVLALLGAPDASTAG